MSRVTIATRTARDAARGRRGKGDGAVRRGSRALAVLVTLGAAGLSTLLACADDDTVYAPAVAADASSDATVASDTGPVPPAFDAGGDAAPVTCGTASCAPVPFRDVTVLPACCAAGNTCGYQLDAVAGYLPVPSGCMPAANPGVSDDACPTYASTSSLFPGDLQGCCRADHTCGVFIQLSSSIDLGCVPAAGFTDDAAAPAAPCGFDAGDGG